jgi:hypothetical protein
MNFMNKSYKTADFKASQKEQSYKQLKEVFRQSDGPAVWLVGVCVAVAWFLTIPVSG